MSDTRVFVGAMAAGLAAIAAAWFLYTKTSTSSFEGEDGPGPNLVIDVSGPGAQGTVVIDLLPDVAPQHAQRLTELAEAGAYDNVVFHRVIDGFMAQTGDVEFGKADGGQLEMAGSGKSELPNLPAEFSDIPFLRGIVGMARSNRPDTANSQFFIMFEPAPHLNGSYTVFGQVTEGMECIDKIKRGGGANGMVSDPDKIIKMEVVEK